MKPTTPLIPCLFAVACGGGATTAPPTTPEPAVAPSAAPALALGTATIRVTGPDAVEVEIALAADGTVSSTGKTKQTTKRATLTLTPQGELLANGEVIVKLTGDTVLSRRSEEVRENGAIVKSESKLEDVGTIDAAGVFTNKLDGKQLAFDAEGHLPAALGTGTTVTLTAQPEHRRAAMLVFIGTMLSHRMVTDISGSKAEAVQK